MNYLILVSHGQFSEGLKDALGMFVGDGIKTVKAIGLAQKSINWTIFIQLLRQHLRYDCDYKN
jgi:mannose/fructose-specific phosphotransferase system component IIA